MEDEFYAIIKLVSGEEIMSVVMADDNNDEVILILQNPVTMQMYQNGVGHYIKVKPWIFWPRRPNIVEKFPFSVR